MFRLKIGVTTNVLLRSIPAALIIDKCLLLSVTRIVNHFANLTRYGRIIKGPIAKGKSLTEFPHLLAAEH